MKTLLLQLLTMTAALSFISCETDDGQFGAGASPAGNTTSKPKVEVKKHAEVIYYDTMTQSDTTTVSDTIAYPEIAQPETITVQEISPPDQTQETGDQLCAAPGGFGCLCEVNAECNSGFCITTPEGQMCTVMCFEECPLDWLCKAVQNTGDIYYICTPEVPIFE